MNVLHVEHLCVCLHLIHETAVLCVLVGSLASPEVLLMLHVSILAVPIAALRSSNGAITFIK